MRTPIRNQFMLPLIAVASISLLTVGLVSSQMAMRQARQQVETQLRGVVAVLSNSSFPLTEPVLRQMSGLANAEFVLTDSGSRLIAASSAIDPTDLPVVQPAEHGSESFHLGKSVMVAGERYRHSAVRVAQPGRTREPALLHVLFSDRRFAAAWRAAFLPPMVVGAAMVLAVALVTHLIASRLSRNLTLLGSEVQRLAQGEFSEISPPRWDDETRDLTKAINKTAERLRGYQQELRQTEQLRTISILGAGLAHELRNAATGCRMAVDLHAESCPKSGHDESLGVACRQLELMENRLQQLLHMGRRPEAAQEEEVDLCGVLTESVELILPAAKHAGVRLDWRQPDVGSSVRGDPSLLAEAIMNLLLNALDAAAKLHAQGGPPGLVQVELANPNGHAEVTVTDSGAGPDAPQDADLFQPLVTSKPEGVGLGLAVAKQVVTAQRGTIDWRRVEGRTVFRIRLPLATAGEPHA